MQVGQIIRGKENTYILRQQIGNPGLYGQAYLCAPSDKNNDFNSNNASLLVVKSIRKDAPRDAKQRLHEEAKTLEKVTEAEEQVGVHYAIRLIDQSADDQLEAFIVLEQATGENFAEQILPRDNSFKIGGNFEFVVLEIMYNFAKALRCVHQAGLLYLDMKLDNLFWNSEQQTLRIIDWNVVQETSFGKGVAGDWARFGARLYEAYTGQYLEISPEGNLSSNGPTGTRWSSLPFGIQTIITEALALRYTNDDTLISDLERELKLLSIAQQQNFQKLLDIAQAETNKQSKPITILAALSRAETLVEQLPGTKTEQTLNSIHELKQLANERLGRVSNQILNQAFTFLKQGNFSLAQQYFQRSYDNSSKKDARARRGLWLSRIATRDLQRYSSVATELQEAIDTLDGDPENLRISERRLTMVKDLLQDQEEFKLLQLETKLLQAKFSEDQATIQRVLDEQYKFNRFYTDYPDLYTLYNDLAEKLKWLQENEKLQQQKSDLQAKITKERLLIEQINYNTPYRDQLALFTKLKQSLTALGDKNLASELHQTNLRINDLTILNEYENLIQEAQNTSHDQENLEALYQRAKASPLAALIEKLILYGEQKQEKLKQQLADQQKHIENTIIHYSNKNNEIMEDILQSLIHIKDFTQDSSFQNNNMLHQIHNSIIHIRDFTHNSSFQNNATLEQIHNTISSIKESTQDTYQLDHTKQDNSVQLLQLQYKFDLINYYINSGLLESAEREMQPQYEHSDVVVIDALKQKLAKRKETAQQYHNKLGELLSKQDTQNIPDIVEIYSDLSSIQIDNNKYYEDGKQIISLIFDSLDREIKLPRLFKTSHLFNDYSKLLTIMWKDILKARKLLLNNSIQLPCCEEFYQQLKLAFLAMVELREAQKLSSPQRDNAIKNAIAKIQNIHIQTDNLTTNLQKVIAQVQQ